MGVDRIMQMGPASYEGLTDIKADVSQEKNIKDIAKKADNIRVSSEVYEDEEFVTPKNSDGNKMTEEEARNATKMVNELLEASFRRLDISVHKKTNQVMIKVIDTASDEVIREVPPERSLDVLANMWELAGILVDKQG